MINWKIKCPTKANGYNGYIGQVPCFSIEWEPHPSTGNKYRLTSTLPCYQSYSMHFETQALAMRKAEALLTDWLRATRLTPTTSRSLSQRT